MYFFGDDIEGKYSQDTQLSFILILFIHKMYRKVPLDFSRSLKTDLPMEWGKLEKKFPNVQVSEILDRKQVQCFKHQIFFNSMLEYLS